MPILSSMSGFFQCPVCRYANELYHFVWELAEQKDISQFGAVGVLLSVSPFDELFSACSNFLCDSNNQPS